MRNKKLEKKIIKLGGGELVDIFNNYEGQEAETDKEKELRTLKDAIKKLKKRVEQVKEEIVKLNK